MRLCDPAFPSLRSSKCCVASWWWESERGQRGPWSSVRAGGGWWWTRAAVKEVGDVSCGPADGLDVGYAGKRENKSDIAKMSIPQTEVASA